MSETLGSIPSTKQTVREWGSDFHYVPLSSDQQLRQEHKLTVGPGHLQGVLAGVWLSSSRVPARM